MNQHPIQREEEYLLVARLNSAETRITSYIIYTLSDLVVLSDLIGLLSLANEHYSPPTN